MKIKPNEPAFPAQELNPSVAQTDLSWGLTKREYFAAHAPITFMEAYAQCQFHRRALNDAERGALWAFMAMMRLEYADALIEALNER